VVGSTVSVNKGTSLGLFTCLSFPIQTCRPYKLNATVKGVVSNPLTPNDPYRGRTAPLTSKVSFYIFIQQISVLNILNMVYTLLFFSLQNAVCFIILTYLVPYYSHFIYRVC